MSAPKLEDVQVQQPELELGMEPGPDTRVCANGYELLSTNGTEKATLVMLVRNRELKEALRSMRSVEDRFNRKFHYPWTFLNDKPFTKDVSISGFFLEAVANCSLVYYVYDGNGEWAGGVSGYPER